MGEDALPNPPRPDIRKGRQYADCNAGECGGRMGEGVFRGEHGKGRDVGVGRIRAGRLGKKGSRDRARRCLMHSRVRSAYDCHRYPIPLADSAKMKSIDSYPNMPYTVKL